MVSIVFFFKPFRIGSISLSFSWIAIWISMKWSKTRTTTIWETIAISRTPTSHHPTMCRFQKKTSSTIRRRKSWETGCCKCPSTRRSSRFCRQDPATNATNKCTKQLWSATAANNPTILASSQGNLCLRALPSTANPAAKEDSKNSGTPTCRLSQTAPGATHHQNE
jgi:hypothetical protein